MASAPASSRVIVLEKRAMQEPLRLHRRCRRGSCRTFRDLGFIEYNGEIKVNTALLTIVLHD